MLSVEHDFQRGVLQRTEAKNRKAEHSAVLVDLFHHLVARRLAEGSRLLVEDDLQKVLFRVEPELHFSILPS